MTNLKLRDLSLAPPTATPYWFQERGRAFERVLTGFLSRESMEPRGIRRPSGEEIDGSFAMGERFFLLEAKWHAVPISASAIYAFKGKVDGKLVGTIGAFFSMSDYSTDAVDALLFGKELNVILFGREDLLLIEGGRITMREAMRVKLRYAAEYGQPFLALETYLAEQAKQGRKDSITKSQQEWTILVESVEDVRTIEELLKRFNITAKLTIFPAGGQLSVAPLAQHLRRSGDQNVAAIVTPIADLESQQKHLIELNDTGVELISLPMPIEDWLGYHVPVDIYNSTIMLTNRNGKMARRYARNTDLAQLLTATPAFAALIQKLEAQPDPS